MRIALLASLTLLATPLLAQQRTTFAVLPLESQQSFGLDPAAASALSVGLAQLMANELERSPGGHAIPRTTTDDAVGKEQPSGRTRVDAATAAKIGQLVGAQYVILGNFVNFYDKFRLNVRVVDAKTGEIIRGLSNDDPKLQGRAQMYEIVRSVAAKILKELGLPPAPASGASVSADAVIAWSIGLEAEDAGDRAKAAASYQQALTSSPDFAEAKEGLARVR
jgi:TolB-like protein